MSWYTNFYIGYQTPDGKIYPYGPFDYSGDYKCAHWTSRSFTTDLKEYFEPIQKDQLSQEMIDAIFNIEINDDYDLSGYWGVCPIDALPSGDFIKKGYFLIEDIENYQKDNDSEGLFYDWMDGSTYAMKLENELKFGKPEKKTDDFGTEYIPHSCGDYAYYCYPEYQCKEYEAYKLRTIAYAMYDDYSKDIPENAKLVIFKTEG